MKIFMKQFKTKRKVNIFKLKKNFEVDEDPYVENINHQNKELNSLMNERWKKDKNNLNNKNNLKDNLKKPKNNLISNLIDYNNYSKQLSFINNNLIQKKCQKELKIMDEIEDKKQKKKYPINNLINQNIKLNNNTYISPFNMLIGSTSTKPDSNYDDSMKLNNNNPIKNNILPKSKKKQSNLYYTYYGLNNKNYLNNNLIKNSTFSNSKISNNNLITYTNNFSKSSNLNNIINNNLINNFSPKNIIFNNKKNDNEFLININDIISGKEKRTFIQIKNIPDKLEINDFIKEINIKMEFDNKINYQTYDCIYLPINKKNTKLNIGYAFINFIKPLCIIDFYFRFNGFKWKNNKECEITFAEKYKDELNNNLLENFGDCKKVFSFNNNEKLNIRIPIQFKNNFNVFKTEKIEFIKI